jgi:STAS-like domain of unknown function (DUF4325)
MARKGGPMPTVRMADFGTLLLTRGRGREVANQLPRRTRLVLDLDGVEVASPSFLDEVIRGAFEAGVQEIMFVHASERAAESLKRLQSLRQEGGEDRPLLEVAT